MCSIAPCKPTPPNSPHYTSASQRPPWSRHAPSSLHLLTSHASPMHLRYTSILERESVVTLLIMDVLSNVYWLAKLKKLLCWMHCRRCDRRTNMISHVDNILQTCKATDLHDQVMKIFNLGELILKISGRRIFAIENLHNFVMQIRSFTHLENILNMRNHVNPPITASTIHLT